MLAKNTFTTTFKNKRKLVSLQAEAVEVTLSPGQFAVLLALLVSVTFMGVLLGKQTFVFRDFGLFSYPVAHFHRQSFWSGEVPLWNPLSYCGLPFMAQWNTMSLYPPSLLYMFFPLGWSLPFFCVAHLFWGGLGMYFLARNVTRHPLAPVLAGVAFSFNGLTLSLLTWQSHIATFSWVPWVIWLGQRGWRQGGKSLLWGIFAGAMQMLGGAPETIVFTWLVLFFLACGDWIRLETPRVRLVCRFIGIAIMVALLCAPQLLPFLQLLSHSQRDSGFGSAGWSMPIWGWANLLVPLFRTVPTPQGVYLQEGQYAFSSYYAGVGVLVLGVFAVRYTRDWRARGAAILILFGLVLALGDRGGVYRVVRGFVPALGFSRYPIKFVILVAALFPLLAAFGFDAIASRPGRLRTFDWGCALTVLALMTGIVLLQPNTLPTTWHAIVQNEIERALILLLTLLILDVYLRTKKCARFFPGLLLALMFWLDLAQMPTVNPTASPVVYSPGWVERGWKTSPKPGESRGMVAHDPELALNLHSMKSLEDTFMLQRLGLFSDCNLIDEVPQVHGFFSLMPAEINMAIFSLYERTNLDFSPFLDFLGVSQILISAETFDWTERSGAMPLVTVGQQPVFVDDWTVLSAYAATNVDFRKLVFLPQELRAKVTAAGQPIARVAATKFSNQGIAFQVSSPSTSIAVISQTFYSCWKAYVDGKPVPLWRANFAFQALEVPAGEHAVTLRYEDKAFSAGVLASALGGLLCVVLWGYEHFCGRVLVSGAKREISA